VRLADGARTTLHVAAYESETWAPRVVRLERPAPLVRWCREQGVNHALVGGFYQRPDYAPLGEVRIDGVVHPYVPFDAPWGEVRPRV
jgi:hypothetical protein